MHERPDTQNLFCKNRNLQMQNNAVLNERTNAPTGDAIDIDASYRIDKSLVAATCRPDVTSRRVNAYILYKLRLNRCHWYKQRCRFLLVLLGGYRVECRVPTGNIIIVLYSW